MEIWWHNYGGDNFEESGVIGNMDLAGDYGGNYSCGNKIGSGVYGEGGNSEIGGNSGIRYWRI